MQISYSIDRESLRITDIHVVRTIEWSPTGTHIIFSIAESIFLLSLESGKVEKLFYTTHWFDPAAKWANDGSHFCFYTSDGLNVANIQDRLPRLVGMGKRFLWTDSDEIMFWNDTGTYVYSLEGNINPVDYADGILSPDRRRTILKFKDRIQIADSDGANPFSLDTLFYGQQDWRWGYAWANYITWGPKGEHLAYAQRADKKRIFIVNLETPSFCVVNEGVKPLFSPDGSRIAFSDDDAKPTKLSICNTDGSSVTEVDSTPERGEYYGYGWSPDSNKIAFSKKNEISVMDV